MQVNNILRCLRFGRSRRIVGNASVSISFVAIMTAAVHASAMSHQIPDTKMPRMGGAFHDISKCDVSGDLRQVNLTAEDLLDKIESVHQRAQAGQASAAELREMRDPHADTMP